MDSANIVNSFFKNFLFFTTSSIEWLFAFALKKRFYSLTFSLSKGLHGICAQPDSRVRIVRRWLQISCLHPSKEYFGTKEVLF